MILYANNKMKLLVNKYDMTYVDIHNSFLANEEYLSSEFEIHPTKSGYKAMAEHIIKLIDKKTLAKQQNTCYNIEDFISMALILSHGERS